jgi:hypothetical protein
MESFHGDFIIANMFIVASFFIPEIFIKIMLFLIGGIWLFMGWINFKYHLEREKLEHKIEMLKTEADVRMNEGIARRLDHLIELQ